MRGLPGGMPCWRSSGPGGAALAARGASLAATPLHAVWAAFMAVHLLELLLPHQSAARSALEASYREDLPAT